MSKGSTLSNPEGSALSNPKGSTLSNPEGSTLSNPDSPSSSLVDETPFVVGGLNPHIILETWSLDHTGVVQAWVSEFLHKSPQYKAIQDCFNTKRTYGRITLYEYNIPLTNIKMMGCHEMGNGWHKIIGWQGLYKNTYLVKFTLATQNKMRYHVQSDTEIINIVEHLRVNSQLHKETAQTAAPQSTLALHNKQKNHKFVKSDDCILCEWCGSTLDEVRSEKRNNILPGCSGNFTF